MLKEQIVVGSAYVNEGACVLREVVEEVDARHIRFNTFDLATGKFTPTRHRIADRSEMQHWAERLATRSELMLIHPVEDPHQLDAAVHRLEHAVRMEASKTALESAPSPYLSPQLK